MRKAASWATWFTIVAASIVAAADPAYVGRWKVNEEKSDDGQTLTPVGGPTGQPANQSIVYDRQ